MPAEVIGKKLRCKNCGQIFRAQADNAIPVVEDLVPVAEPELLPLPEATPYEAAPPNHGPLGAPQNPVPLNPAYPQHGTTGTQRSVAGARSPKNRPKSRADQWNEVKKKKKRSGGGGGALEDGELGWIKTGVSLVILGFLGMLLPSFGLTLKILYVIGDYAPIAGVLFALGGAGCIAAGLQRFPLAAAGAGGSISLFSVIVCVLVMLSIFRDMSGTDQVSQNAPNRRGSVDEQVKAFKDSQKRASDRPSFPSGSSFSNKGAAAPRIPTTKPPSSNEDAKPGARSVQPPRSGNRGPFGNRRSTTRPPRRSSGVSGSSRGSSGAGNSGSDSFGNGTLLDPTGDNPFEDMDLFKNPPSKDNSGADSGDANRVRSFGGNDELEQYFGSRGWFSEQPAKSYYDRNSRFASNREQQLKTDIRKISIALDRKFGGFWQKSLPHDYLTKTAGTKRKMGDRFLHKPAVHPEKVPVVGIRYEVREFAGTTRISALVPVFDRKNQDADSLAKDGYALAGLNVIADKYVNRVQVIYMRIDGDQFDSSDQYESDWYGVRSGGDEHQLAGDGRAVFGFNVNQGIVVDGIQLFHDPK